MANLTEMEGLGLVAFLFLCMLLLVSPLACWCYLARLLKLQREALYEMKVLNLHVRSGRQNAEYEAFTAPAATPQSPAESGRIPSARPVRRS